MDSSIEAHVAQLEDINDEGLALAKAMETSLEIAIIMLKQFRAAIYYRVYGVAAKAYTQKIRKPFNWEYEAEGRVYGKMNGWYEAITRLVPNTPQQVEIYMGNTHDEMEKVVQQEHPEWFSNSSG